MDYFGRWLSRFRKNFSLERTVLLAYVGGVIAVHAFRRKRPSTQKKVEYIEGMPHAEYNGPGDWYDYFALYTKIAKTQKANIVFYGDSLIHNFKDVGLTTWKEFFADKEAVNFGIPFERTEHLIWRIKNGNAKFEQGQPAVAVVHIGIHNLENGEYYDDVLDGIRGIIKVLQQRLPNTKILLLPILPRASKDKLAAEIEKVNYYLSFIKGVSFVDITSHFKTKEGELFHNQLTERGYRTWALAINGKLHELLKAAEAAKVSTEAAKV